MSNLKGNIMRSKYVLLAGLAMCGTFVSATAQTPAAVAGKDNLSAPVQTQPPTATEATIATLADVARANAAAAAAGQPGAAGQAGVAAAAPRAGAIQSEKPLAIVDSNGRVRWTTPQFAYQPLHPRNRSVAFKRTWNCNASPVAAPADEL